MGEAQLIQAARWLVFNDEVSRTGELPEQILASGVSDIECDAALAGIEIEKSDRVFCTWVVADEGRFMALRATGHRWFDQNDIGAHPCEGLAAVV